MRRRGRARDGERVRRRGGDGETELSTVELERLRVI
ncbi:uncharacterized protein G2W53_003654 [Senna tora]|uniref:Uncharacterized protein n=1 Tax=Senna tora TaxID=362788 RepID=A0A834XAC5_9FABA|nr:uncharacterized protein G2W53_003654 [Senna tora]